MSLLSWLFNHNKNDNKSTSEVDKDAWEGSFWDVQQPFPVKATFHIIYIDGAGNKTERTVDIKQFGALLGTNLLIGNCRLRSATRTFRTDRIQQCVDVETGEVIEDVAEYLRTKYELSPEYSRDQLRVDEYDVLRVLLYVGKADGVLRASEKVIIRDTCRELVGDARMTDEMIDELFKNLSVPTVQAFKLAIGRLNTKSAILKSVVFSAAEKMIATDKKIHQSEQEALDYMRKKWQI